MRLILDDDPLDGPVTAEGIEAALLRTGEGSFLILERSGECYMQTLGERGSFVLERREGGPGQHEKAVRAGGGDLFTFEEIVEAMTAYWAGQEMPAFLRWQALDLASPS